MLPLFYWPCSASTLRARQEDSGSGSGGAFYYPHPPIRDPAKTGSFNLTLVENSNDRIVYNVVDSLSSSANGVSIPVTNQQTTCTITRDGANAAVACSPGAWAWIAAGDGITIQHFVQYRNGLYGNNSVTDGPAYRVREVYDVRVFILNDAQPGAPSSRAVTESAVTDEGYSFDYIDDTGPRNPDQATTPPGPPVIPN